MTAYSPWGIQAIGAMTFGTESIPTVNKIFGPGNQYVMAAKRSAQYYGVAIDMPAGPSELLVIADWSCNPSFVAADLLSQAEHGPDSQVILLSDDKRVVKEVIKEIDLQIEQLPRKELAKQAMKNSKAILFKTLEECMSFSNFTHRSTLSWRPSSPPCWVGMWSARIGLPWEL